MLKQEIPAKTFAFLWSSSSFPTFLCKATRAAAQRTPLCLIPPPRVFLSLLAYKTLGIIQETKAFAGKKKAVFIWSGKFFFITLLIKLWEPTMIDPTGAPRPLDRHTWFTNLRRRWLSNLRSLLKKQIWLITT